MEPVHASPQLAAEDCDQFADLRDQISFILVSAAANLTLPSAPSGNRNFNHRRTRDIRLVEKPNPADHERSTWADADTGAPTHSNARCRLASATLSRPSQAFGAARQKRSHRFSPVRVSGVSFIGLR